MTTDEHATIDAIRNLYEIYIDLMRECQPYGPQLPRQQTLYHDYREALIGSVSALLAALDAMSAENARLDGKYTEMVRIAELQHEALQHLEGLYRQATAQVIHYDLPLDPNTMQLDQRNAAPDDATK